MYYIDLGSGGHKFEKQNLVTQSSRRGGFDKYKCSYCGMLGTSRTLGGLEVSETYKKDNVLLCHKAPPPPQRIKITRCTASGPAFKNILPGTEHDVIEPPAGYANTATGVWVQGSGEPVKVLSNEYISL